MVLIHPMGFTNSVTSALGLKSGVRAEEDVSSGGVRKTSNMAYRADARSGHFLDVFWPQDPSSSVPVLFYFNSGSFHKSNRSCAAGLCNIIAQRNFVVINCEFPDLGRGVGADAQLGDVMHLMKWVATNSGRYKTDLERVYVAGSSYGALMAFWMALLCNSKRLPAALGMGEAPFRVKGLGLFNGMTDTESGDRIMRSICKSISKAESSNKDLGEAMRPWSNHDLRDLPPVYQITGDSDSALPDVHRMNLLLEENAVVHDTLEFDNGIRTLNGFMEDYAAGSECARSISKMFGFFADNQ